MTATPADSPLDPKKVLAQAAAGIRRDSEASVAAAPAPSIEELAPSFPGYRITSLVGRGGMGAVYRARHVQLDREVALKILPPGLAGDPAFEERFIREARALAMLEHPNILRVFDFGQAGGEWFYLATEFVDGANLRQLMELDRISPAEALRLVPQICDALDFAHGRGVVHRDIKPENVLVDLSGRVKIADFGLAKLTGEAEQSFNLTMTQQVLGTPHYIAPEQLDQATAVDHRADIFSLGVVIYEMLTGRLPIGRFEAPSKRSGSAANLDAVVMRSLQPEPRRRYQSAAALKADLHGEPDARERQRESWKQSRTARRERQVTQRTLAAALGFVGAVLFILFPGHLISMLSFGMLIVGCVLMLRGRSAFTTKSGRVPMLNNVVTWLPLTTFGALIICVAIEPRDPNPWAGLISLLFLVWAQVWIVTALRRG